MLHKQPDEEVLHTHCQLHMGLSIVGKQHVAGRSDKNLELLSGMKGELARLEAGITSYDPTKPLETQTHIPSPMFLLPHMQQLVKLQQGLMVAYSMNAAQTGALVLSEPSSMQFASSATCMQPHGMHVCFQVCLGDCVMFCRGCAPKMIH